MSADHSFVSSVFFFALPLLRIFSVHKDAATKTNNPMDNHGNAVEINASISISLLILPVLFKICIAEHMLYLVGIVYMFFLKKSIDRVGFSWNS